MLCCLLVWWWTEVSTLAGGLNDTQAAYADGMGQQAGFNTPYGVAVDTSSNVFVAERWTHRIRKVTPNGGMHLVHVFLDVSAFPSFGFSFH